MLKSLLRVILFSLIAVSLIACNDSAKNTSSDLSIDTGVIDCDRYIKLVHELQLSSKLQADPQESLENTINHFKQLIEKIRNQLRESVILPIQLCDQLIANHAAS